MKRLVFLDTVGLLALWDRSDQWHAAAEAAFKVLKKDKVAFLTTSFVMAECGNAAARRPYREAAAQLRARMETSGKLVFPAQDEWTKAWEMYERGEGGNAGIVDQLSFLVARKHGITQIFSNDKHFSAAGFEILF